MCSNLRHIKFLNVGFRKIIRRVHNPQILHLNFSTGKNVKNVRLMFEVIRNILIFGVSTTMCNCVNFAFRIQQCCLLKLFHILSYSAAVTKLDSKRGLLSGVAMEVRLECGLWHCPVERDVVVNPLTAKPCHRSTC
jgi:hypothetical protein